MVFMSRIVGVAPHHCHPIIASLSGIPTDYVNIVAHQTGKNMKRKQVKIRLKVKDRWFPEYGTGTIVNVLKTRIKVKYPTMRDLCTYDNSHLYFLDILPI